MAGLSPYQTVGPYLHIGLRVGCGPMTSATHLTPLVLVGRLLDGGGTGISDGVLEFWAAGFDSLGRVPTQADGAYRLEARLPATRRHGDRTEAPHFAVRVLGRGILTSYVTRVYFEGQPANDVDSILQAVPADRRPTLIAAPLGDGSYRFDIVVQGPRETVFFDV